MLESDKGEESNKTATFIKQCQATVKNVNIINSIIPHELGLDR
jgi:hypothetical protein